MKKYKILLIFFLFLTSAMAKEDQKKVAVILMIKGEAFSKNDQGEVVKVKKDLWLYEGSILRTKEKSFVKILFHDKSSINLGPDSQIKITQFHEEKAAIIDLLRGSIRAKISKDYMKINEKDRSKLLVKTKSAAMGVRGTDFTASYDYKKNITHLQVWEGQVLFAKNIDQSSVDSIDSELNKKGIMVIEGNEIKNDNQKETPPEITPISEEKIKKYEEEIKKQNLESSFEKNKILIPTIEIEKGHNAENLTKEKEKIEFRPLNYPLEEIDKNASVQHFNEHKDIPKEIPQELQEEIQKQQRELKEVYETHRQITESHQKEMIKEHTQHQQILIEKEKETDLPPPPPPTGSNSPYP